MKNWYKKRYNENHDFHIKDYYLQKRANYFNDILKLNSLKGENVLDIAIGNNTYIYNLNFSNKYAIELDESFCNFHSKNGIKVYSHDLNDGLPKNIKDKKIDLIFALEILEHILDGEKLLYDLNEVLNKNGKLIITVPNDTGFYINRLETFFRGHPYGKNKSNIYNEQHIRFFSFNLAKRTFEEFFDIEYMGGGKYEYTK